MVRQARSDLDNIFVALSDPTRRAVLSTLLEGDAYVNDLAIPHDMSLAAISRHIHVLEAAGLVIRSKEGRKIRCSLRVEPLEQVSDWVSHHQQMWEHKLDALGSYLDEK